MPDQPVDGTPAVPATPAPPPIEFDLALPQATELRDATALLDAGDYARARTALAAVKAALADDATDATAQRLLAVASHRLGEAIEQLGLQKAKTSHDDEGAEKLLVLADKELADIGGEDFGTRREGSSLQAAALRRRGLLNAVLYVGYRDLAKARPNVRAYPKKCNQYARAGKDALARLENGFPTATMPDGRRVVDVTRAEAEKMMREPPGTGR